jgi:hypothetical protein
MNRRKSNITREANAPLDCHTIDWWFTTDGAGAVVSFASTVESVTSGTIDAVAGYRVKLKEPAPLNNITSFSICNTTPPASPELTAHYFTDFTGTGTVTVIGLANPALEFDVFAEAAGVVALAASVRISGALVVDTAPLQAIEAHGG